MSPAGADDETQDRLQTLELKIMDLEHTIQQLNDVITAQYKLLDSLQMQQQGLAQRLDTLSSGSNGDTDPRHEPPPPHY